MPEYKYLDFKISANIELLYLEEMGRDFTYTKQVSILARHCTKIEFSAMDNHWASTSPHADLYLRAADGIIYLAQRNIFSATFQSNDSIIIELNEKSPKVDPQLIILNLILPIYSAYQQYVPVHISALKHPCGGCVVFAGDPGAGKSTIVAELSMKLGWPILVDDNTAICPSDGSVLVYPSSRNIRLWPDSLARLQMPYEVGTTSQALNGKIVIAAAEKYAKKSEFVKSWINLTWSDQNEIRELSGIAALKAIRNSFYLGPIAYQLVGASVLDATISALLHSTRFMELKRRREAPVAIEKIVNWIDITQIKV